MDVTKKKRKEKDAIHLPLDQIGYHGITEEGAHGQNGLVKTLAANVFSESCDGSRKETLDTL